jgi:hypothetical protein
MKERTRLTAIVIAIIILFIGYSLALMWDGIRQVRKKTERHEIRQSADE